MKKRVTELETKVVEAKRHEIEEKERAKKYAEELKAAELQKQASNTRYDQLLESFNSVSSQNAKLRQQQEAGIGGSEVAKVREAMQKMEKAKNEEIEQANQTIEKLKKDLAAKETEALNLRKTSEANGSQTSRLTEEVQSLRAQLDAESEKMRKVRAEFDSQVSEAREEKHSMEQRLREAVSGKESVEREAQLLKSKLSERDAEAEALRKQNIDKEVQIQTLQKVTEQTSSSISNQLNDLTSANVTLKSQLDVLTRTKSELENELAAVKKHLSEAEARADELAKFKINISKELEELRKGQKKAENDIATLKETCETKERDIDNLRREREKLEGQIQRFKEDAMDMEEAFQRLQTHIQEREAEVVALKKQLREASSAASSGSQDDLKRELELLRQAHAEVQKVADLNNKRRTELEKELEQVKKTLATEREQTQLKIQLITEEKERAVQAAASAAPSALARSTPTPAPAPEPTSALSSLSTSYYLFTPLCMLEEQNSGNPQLRTRNNALRKFVSTLNEAVGILVVYFGGNAVSQEEKNSLGDDSQHPEISMIVRGKFCSTLTMVLGQGFTSNSLWTYLETLASDSTGSSGGSRFTSSLSRSIMNIKNRFGSHNVDPNMRFRSWVATGLNEKCFHEWILLLASSASLTSFFTEEAILRNENALQATAHALKPLYNLPFKLNPDFELSPPTGPIKAASQLLSCTWMTTGDEGGHQAWYYCYNCATPDNTPMKCCVNCIVMCHAGHQITFAEESMICCDCGVTEECTIIDDEFDEEEEGEEEGLA